MEIKNGPEKIFRLRLGFTTEGQVWIQPLTPRQLSICQSMPETQNRMSNCRHESCQHVHAKTLPHPTVPVVPHLYLLFSPASLTMMLWVLVEVVVLAGNMHRSILNTVLCQHHKGKRQLVLLKYKPKSQTFCTALPQGLINATYLSCLWMLKNAGAKRPLIAGTFIEENERLLRKEKQIT